MLADGDLIEIVRSKSGAHQTSVARRVVVAEGVSSALVEDGHVDAVHTLLQNAGARIGRPAMEKAIDRSRQETTLQGPLVDRHDMPVDLLQDMFWFLSGVLRKKIITISGVAAPEAFSRPGVAVRKPAPPKDKAAHKRARAYIQNMKATGRFGRPLLIDLFKRRAILELIIGFALFVSISEATALQILCDEGGEGLVLACKASGFDIGSFMIFAGFGTLRNPRPAPVLAEPEPEPSPVGAPAADTAEPVKATPAAEAPASEARAGSEAPIAKPETVAVPPPSMTTAALRLQPRG